MYEHGSLLDAAKAILQRDKEQRAAPPPKEVFLGSAALAARLGVVPGCITNRVARGALIPDAYYEAPSGKLYPLFRDAEQPAVKGSELGLSDGGVRCVSGSSRHGGAMSEEESTIEEGGRHGTD